MYKFSKKSLENINMLIEPLKDICYKAIEKTDFSVIYSYREPYKQLLLYSKGRRLENGKWYVIDKSKIVTYKDGLRWLSKHNYLPSLAMDLKPYPKAKIQDFKDLANIIFDAWQELQKENPDYQKLTLAWGGDWQKFKDYYHWEIKDYGGD